MASCQVNHTVAFLNELKKKGNQKDYTMTRLSLKEQIICTNRTQLSISTTVNETILEQELKIELFQLTNETELKNMEM